MVEGWEVGEPGTAIWWKFQLSLGNIHEILMCPLTTEMSDGGILQAAIFHN